MVYYFGDKLESSEGRHDLKGEVREPQTVESEDNRSLV